MRQPVRGNKKSAVQPVTVITEKKFNPKVSKRTIRKRQKERENRLKAGICSSTLSICGVVFLYIFLVLCVLIAAGGIAICIVYLNTDDSTRVWKIVGIVLGAIICTIAIILILLSIFKQTRNRTWKRTKEEKLVSHDTYYTDDVEDLDTDDDDNNNQNNQNQKEIRRTQETASSPIPILSYGPGQLNSTESIGIQTEEGTPATNRSHTTIDRSKKPSTTIETQTNRKSDSTENIIFRRVPIPTAKVVVQQPATKVMIVRVPNTAGELIIQQPRELSMHDKN